MIPIDESVYSPSFSTSLSSQSGCSNAISCPNLDFSPSGVVVNLYGLLSSPPISLINSLVYLPFISKQILSLFGFGSNAISVFLISHVPYTSFPFLPLSSAVLAIFPGNPHFGHPFSGAPGHDAPQAQLLCIKIECLAPKNLRESKVTWASSNSIRFHSRNACSIAFFCVKASRLPIPLALISLSVVFCLQYKPGLTKNAPSSTNFVSHPPNGSFFSPLGSTNPDVPVSIGIGEYSSSEV